MQPIKSRGAFLILIAMVAQSYVIINSAARFMVGRWKYPCFLYSIMFSVVIPFAFLPGVLRTFRLIYIVKLNSLKKFVANIKSGANGNHDDGDDLKKAGNNGDRGNNRQNTQNSSTAGSGHSTSLSVFKSRQQQRTFKLWKFWVSNKFIVLCFLVSVIVHLGIWGILAGTSADPALYFSFRQSCHMSSIDSYVIVGQALFYIGINLLLLLFAIVRRVEDTWAIRLESVLVLIQWVFFFVIFVLIAALFWYFYIQAERYWPYGYFLIMACFIDILASAWIPLIRSFFIPQHKQTSRLQQFLQVQSTSTANVDQLKVVLEDEQFKRSFREFCERSFCPEMLLFWDEAKQYEQLREDHERRVAAKNIVERYLRLDAPLELNLPNKDVFIPEICEAINQYESSLLQGVHVGTTLLAEMGMNIALHVLKDEASRNQKENMLNRMKTMALNEEQIIAEAVERYQSILKESTAKEQEVPFDETAGAENVVVRGEGVGGGVQHHQASAADESTHGEDTGTDQMSTTTSGTTGTSATPSSTNTPSKRRATMDRIKRRLRKSQNGRHVGELEHGKEKAIENKLPDHLFHRLISHTELDMMDIFARYKTTKAYKKHLDRLKEEVSLKDLVVFST